MPVPSACPMTPEPATVVTTPSGVTFLMTSFQMSTRKRLPSGSTPALMHVSEKDLPVTEEMVV